MKGNTIPTRYFLIEQHADGKLTVEALPGDAKLFWARNKARATSGMNRSKVFIAQSREVIDVPTEERNL